MTATKLIFLALFAAWQSLAGIALADTEASANEILQPGNRLSDYEERRFVQQVDYTIQRLSERTYWIAVGEYSATLYVGDEGALLIDTSWAGFETRLLEAIQTITDLPVTAVVYSHSHLDHIGGAANVVAALNREGIDPRIVASDRTALQISRFDLPVPRVIDVVPSPLGEYTFENLTLRIHTPDPFVHSDGTSIIELVGEGVLHATDVVAPQQLPFMGFSYPSDMRALIDTLEFMLALDWDFMNAGHWNIGLKQDVSDTLKYIADVKSASLEALTEVPREPVPGNPEQELMSYAVALEAYVLRKLMPEYGHHSHLDTIIGGHMRRIINEIILHNDI